MNNNYKENKLNYLYLKNNIIREMIGGTIDKEIYFIRQTGGKNKFKFMVDKPKLKYVKYDEKNIIHMINTVDNEKLDEYSEFMIGSVTKVFTGIMMIILNDKKILNLDDNITKYIKPNKNNKFDNITIKHLINHTGGIIWYLTYKDIPSKYRAVKSSTEALRIFMDKPLCTEKLGVKKYSSMGYIMLGAIIEKVTNLTYTEALKQYILHPCKMHNTDIGEPNITAYNNNISMDNSKKEEQVEKYMVNSAGGLYSCIADMANFAKYIPKILTKSQIKRCYAYYDDKNTIEHGGFIYGGDAKFMVEYTDKFKIKNVSISLSTCTENNY